MARSNANKTLVKTSIEQARMLLGHGWGHISREIQIGLVSANALAMLSARVDEESTIDASARLGQSVGDVWGMIVDASQNDWIV